MATQCLLPSVALAIFNGCHGCVNSGGRKMRKNSSATSPAPASDRVGNVDEFMLRPESLGHQLSKPPDSKGLGCVMPRADEVEPSLARVGHRMLGRLAREECVEPELGGALNLRGTGSGDDANRAHDLGPGVENEWLAVEELGDAAKQGRGPHAFGAPPDDADRPPPDLGERTRVQLESEPSTEQGVVADLAVGVERQVVGGDGEPLVQGEAEALGHLIAERPWLRVPEKSV